MKTLVAVHLTKLLFFAWMLATLAALTSCACSSAEHRNDPTCVIEHDIVDCTTQEVVSVAPQFLPVVLALVNQLTGGDGRVDWASVESTLLSLGLRDGGCILAELEAQFASKAKASPAAASQALDFHSWFAHFRARHYPPNVRFQLPNGDVR